MEPLSRRHFMAGSIAALVGSGAPSLLTAAPADRWLQYNARLQRGLASSQSSRVPDLAAGLLDETNAFRAHNALPALIDDPQLALAAQAHLADMNDRGFFAHVTPDGFAAGDRVGLLARTVIGGYGENLAFIETSFSPPSAKRFVDNWQDSPGHRANMLAAEYTHVGHAALRFGDKTLAAAVFGVISARLEAPLPLHANGGDLNAALPRAHPAIRTYMVSEASGPLPDKPYAAVGSGPRLGSGAWRLRPMLPRNAQEFDVLAGPIFFT